MSPKNLLRHPKCVSDLSEISTGSSFRELIDDMDFDGKKTVNTVRKVLVCSGQVYFDLLDRKEQLKAKDVAIVRVEQLYPFPQEQMDEVVKKYPKAELVWVQEEPLNMGAWQFVAANFPKYGWSVVSRKASASPATGYASVHAKQFEEIMTKSFE